MVYDAFRSSQMSDIDMSKLPLHLLDTRRKIALTRLKRDHESDVLITKDEFSVTDITVL